METLELQKSKLFFVIQILNPRAEIVHVKGDVSSYIRLQPGDINVNVADMVIDPLRLDVRMVLQRTQAQQFIKDINAGQVIDSMDTYRLTKDGHTLAIWLTVTVLKDEKGHPTSIATTERGVTGRQRDAAAQRAAELAHVHRLNILGEMASGLTHELNQPLAAISQLAN